MLSDVNVFLLFLLILVICLLVYFLIKWAVRDGIKEAYHEITGKITYEDKKNQELTKEIEEGIKIIGEVKKKLEK